MEAEKITQGIENMWRGQNTVSSTATNFRSQITSVLSLNQFFLSYFFLINCILGVILGSSKAQQ